MSITQTVCVFVTLSIQHALRMRHVVICGLLRSTVFFHLINGTTYEKMLLNIKCVLQVSLQLVPEIFFILGKTERDMIENV